MAVNNIQKIKYDSKKQLNKLQKCVEGGDIYSAFLLYNSLPSSVKIKAVPLIAGLYSKLGAIFYETDLLFKLLSNPKFKDYNPQSLLYRLTSNLNILTSDHVGDYYGKMVKDIFKNHFAKNLIDENEVSYTPFNRPILVEDNGKYYYTKAVGYIKDGDLQKAEEWLVKMQVGDPYYSKGVSALSVVCLMKGDVIKAKEFAMSAFIADPSNTEAVYSLLQIAKLSNDESIYDFIKQKMGEDNTSEIMADVYYETKDYKKAIDCFLLYEPFKFNTEAVLAKVAECYLNLLDVENAKKYYKILIAIYPKQTKVRFMLKELELIKEPYTTEKIEKLASNGRYKNEVKKVLEMTNEEFFKLSDAEIGYYFRVALECASDKNLKRIALCCLTNPNTANIVIDCLSEIDLYDRQKQILCSCVFQAGIKQKFYMLVGIKLIEVQPMYPSALYNEYVFYTEQAKSEYDAYLFHLINAFSQSYAFMIIAGQDLPVFIKSSNSLAKKLLSLDLKSREKFASLDEVIYAFCCCFNSEFRNKLSYVFSALSEEKKKEILNFIDYD